MSSIILTTKIGQYRWEVTGDGHQTLWSEAFGENCHSSDGAWNETLYHYVEGTQLLQRLKVRPLHILEVGFGTGLGLEATLAALKSAANPWRFTSLELDGELARWSMARLGYGDPLEVQELKHGELLKWNCRGIEVVIIVGNARLTLPELSESYFGLHPVDAIYQDAFSPKRNPVLWTKEWFDQLFAIAAPGCLMGTYSASMRPRQAMRCAGWEVFETKGFMQKRSATRARKSSNAADKHRLDPAWLPLNPRLERSSTLPATDLELAQSQVSV